MKTPEIRHVPVLHSSERKESAILTVLDPRPGETVLDVTLGLGGHAAGFLECIGPDGALIGLDADERNLAIARNRLEPWGDRVQLIHANFRSLETLSLPPVDILFADLGICSTHVDDPTRGFSYAADGPLDLRFDASTGRSASAFLMESSETDIVHALQEYGEIPRAKSLAARLYKTSRGRGDTWTTTALRASVEDVYRWRAPRVMAQVFQALRIAVNDELGSLEHLLAAIPAQLRPGGRCGIISYHSLEDRMVKHCFRALCAPSLDPTTGAVARAASFRLLLRRPLSPGTDEIEQNPRSRSAKFRAITRQ